MKKISDFDSGLIRHDYKRAVYRAILSEMPPEEIRVHSNMMYNVSEYGREESYYRFCGEREIDLYRFGLKDRMVMVRTRDYFRPIRMRVVLHTGAAYRAPTGISGVRHRKLKDSREGGMGVFFQDSVWVEKTGRGRFKLVVNGILEFKEP